MYLSYSGYKKAACMYAYWHQYINHTDVGLEDCLGSIFGSVIGRLFEDFYVEQLWRKPDTKKVMESRMWGMLATVIKEETSQGKNPQHKARILKWAGEEEGQNPRGMYANKEEIIVDVEASILRGLQSIRYYKFISKGAQAELKLNTDLKGHTLGGKADFVMRRVGHGDLVIVDGKGSMYKDKYLDETQLLWYCMLHKHRTGILPDKSAFLYWRYEPPLSVDWFEFTQADADELEGKVLKKADRIEKLTRKLPTVVNYEATRELFKPKPSEDNCRFCPYGLENMCPKGFAIKTKISERYKTA